MIRKKLNAFKRGEYESFWCFQLMASIGVSVVVLNKVEYLERHSNCVYFDVVKNLFTDYQIISKE